VTLLWLWTSSDSPSPMLFYSDLLRIDAVAGGRSPDGDGQRDARPPAALMQLRPRASVVEMYLCPPAICPARLCSEQAPLVLACLAIQDLGEQNSFRDCGGRRLQASRARAGCASSPSKRSTAPSPFPLASNHNGPPFFRALPSSPASFDPLPCQSLFDVERDPILRQGRSQSREELYERLLGHPGADSLSLARGSRKGRSARAISAEVPTNRFDQDASNWPPP